MSEVNTPRLMAAAKEFNIGKDTLIEFLVSKGFSGDDLKPTSKITEEMYRVLQVSFSRIKLPKQKADRSIFPKMRLLNQKRKEMKKTFLLRKKKKAKPKEVPALLPEEILLQKNQKAAEVVEEQSKKYLLLQKQLPEKPQPEITNIEAPEMEAPKVMDKIDLEHY